MHMPWPEPQIRIARASGVVAGPEGGNGPGGKLWEVVLWLQLLIASIHNLVAGLRQLCEQSCFMAKPLGRHRYTLSSCLYYMLRQATFQRRG